MQFCMITTISFLAMQNFYDYFLIVQISYDSFAQ